MDKNKIRIKNKILDLQNIDLDEVTQGRKRGVEQNIKNKIVIPLLELLDFNVVKDMDFEHTIRNKKADIALIAENKPKIIVECKSIEQNLDKHIKQALDYAIGKQVPFVVLTNGLDFRVYKSFMENVTNPKDRLLFSIKLRDIFESWNELIEWISKKSVSSKKIDKLSKDKEEEITLEISAPYLLENLKRAKNILIGNCKPKIENRYDTDSKFREKVKEWVENSELDLKNEEEWMDKLAKEVTYTFINRLYFYRIAEDFKIVKPKLTKSILPELLKSFSIKQVIRSGFDEILEIDYRAIFDHNLFDMIEFDDNVLERVVFQLSEYNFKNLSSDILGKVYEQHISRDERKSLGQFYTPDWIIEFIIKRIPITKNKTILDPACGSGGFLIKAYDKLEENYKKFGTRKKDIHNNILKNNLFGFDINPFAVQLTATNLVLKNLKERTDTIKILEKDSLGKGLDEWTSKNGIDLNRQTKLINIESEYPKEYDAVIGNPPYFNLKIKDIKEKYPNENFDSIATGKTNIASLFLKKYIGLLKEDGYLGFVVPKSLTYVEPWKPIRKFILDNCQIKAIYDLREAFEGVKLEEIVIILKKTKGINQDDLVNIYYKYHTKKGLIEKKHKVKHSLFNEDFFPIYFYDINLNIKSKIERNSLTLGSFCDITRGAYLQKYKTILTDSKTTEGDIRIMAGKDIGVYKYRGHKYLNLENRKVREFDKKIKRILNERIVSQRIVAQTRNHIKIITTYDKGDNLNVDTVINIIQNEKKFKYKYVLGILNSKLASYYLYNFVYNRAVRSMNFEYVKFLPIKEIPTSKQDEVVVLVDKLLKLNKEIQIIKDKKEKENIQSEIEKIMKNVDKRIYSIYKLSKNEIKEIESLE